MLTRVRHALGTFDGWHGLLAVVFIAAAWLAVLFAARATHDTRHWRQHRNEPIQRWMTVGYVARSYNVPPSALWDALDLPDPRTDARHDRRPLSEIAAARGQTFEQVAMTLQAAITHARAPQSPPAPSRSDRGGP